MAEGLERTILPARVVHQPIYSNRLYAHPSFGYVTRFFQIFGLMT